MTVVCVLYGSLRSNSCVLLPCCFTSLLCAHLTRLADHPPHLQDYFGEKIGLYFKWLGMYTSWLTVAAVLGLGFWINVAYDGETELCLRHW